MRLAFKRGQGRSGAVAESCGNGVGGEARKKKRKRNDEVSIHSFRRSGIY